MFTDIVSDTLRLGHEKGYVCTLYHHFYHFRLSSATNPKMKRAQPEILLIHSSQRAVNLVRSKLTPQVKSTHQKAEPRNTPATTSSAEK
jgi:hypothetical protein